LGLDISFASAISRLVSPLMADTTTTTSVAPAPASWRRAGDVLDPLGRADRGAAVLLNYERHAAAIAGCNGNTRTLWPDGDVDW
jgi:hypothetical protein